MPRPRWTADARASRGSRAVGGSRAANARAAECSRAADARAADARAADVGVRGAPALPARGHLGSAGRVPLPAGGDGGGRGAANGGQSYFYKAEIEAAGGTGA